MSGQSRRSSRSAPSSASATSSVDQQFFANTGVRKLLQPIPRNRLPRRFSQLFVGLVLYGFSMAVMIRAGLGLDPWDVFHQGLTEKVNLSFGVVVIIMSVIVLLLWIPLRQKPGLGTIANAIVVGAATDLGLFLLPAIDNLALAIAAMVLSVPMNALAGALYIGAGLGPGPRDGLMTGLVARGVGSVMVVRSCIEGTVLVVGFLMGGTVFVGTVLYAVGIGPCLHVLMPLFRIGHPAPVVPESGVSDSSVGDSSVSDLSVSGSSVSGSIDPVDMGLSPAAREAVAIASEDHYEGR